MTKTIPKEIWARIEARRTELDEEARRAGDKKTYAKRNVSQGVGMSINWYANALNQKPRLSAEVIRKFSSYLKIPTDQLHGEEADDLRARVFEKLNQGPDSVVEQVDQIVDVLLKNAEAEQKNRESEPPAQ